MGFNGNRKLVMWNFNGNQYDVNTRTNAENKQTNKLISFWKHLWATFSISLLLLFEPCVFLLEKVNRRRKSMSVFDEIEVKNPSVLDNKMTMVWWRASNVNFVSWNHLIDELFQTIIDFHRYVFLFHRMIHRWLVDNCFCHNLFMCFAKAHAAAIVRFYVNISIDYSGYIYIKCTDDALSLYLSLSDALLTNLNYNRIIKIMLLYRSKHCMRQIKLWLFEENMPRVIYGKSLALTSITLGG